MENNFIALSEGFLGDGKFTFGKHRGKSFVEVATSKDVDYFMWLWEKSKPKYKTAWAHDTVWAKKNGWEIVELLPKEKGKYQDAIFVQKPTFQLNQDLEQFIKSNFDRLKKESKRVKNLYKGQRYNELMDNY